MKIDYRKNKKKTVLLYVLFLFFDYQIFIPVLISYFSVLLYK